MATASIPHGRSSARLAMVEEHLRFENAHDLNGVLGTFGDTADYDDEAWGEHHHGREKVRAFYAQLLSALPDLTIHVLRRHVSEEAIVLEVTISGTHLGPWRGLPATSRRVELPLCGVFTFDDQDRLAGERIYYDRATLLRQLGVFDEPDGIRGRINILLAHPITLAKAFARQLVRK
jgi:steroid delta-isomerase-like uncharacterized protein